MVGPGLVLVIALAGGLGAVLRFLVDTAVRARWQGVLPVATVGINVSGSFILGLLTALAAAAGLPREWLLVLGGGLMGGWTTFSTAMIEAVRLHENHRSGWALLHLLGMAVAALAAAAAGWAIGTALG